MPSDVQWAIAPMSAAAPHGAATISASNEPPFMVSRAGCHPPQATQSPRQGRRGGRRNARPQADAAGVGGGPRSRPVHISSPCGKPDTARPRLLALCFSPVDAFKGRQVPSRPKQSD